MATGKNIYVLRDLFTRVLGRKVGGPGEIVIEQMKAPARTLRGMGG